MEKMRSGSLRTEFSAAVAVTMTAVVIVSALTVWGCWAVRHKILPEPNKVALIIEETSADGKGGTRNHIELTLDGSAEPVVWMSEELEKPDWIDEQGLLVGEADFSVESIRASASELSSGKRAAYTAAGVLMAALPMVYAAAGVLLGAMWFYQKRLSPAIAVLDDATRHISGQDLDFTVSCGIDNELGRLCASFEQMRRALCDNNRRLWRTMEERRTMQRCVAHDLRNPLAIMEGTVERMREDAARGELTQKGLEESLEGLSAAAKRMERYTDYIRDLDALEDTQPELRRVDVPEFFRAAARDMTVLIHGAGLEAVVSLDISEGTAAIDREIFYRVLENAVSNALRYARTRVELEIALAGQRLRLRVLDDGPGFSQRMLTNRHSLYYSEDHAGGHMGLGLAESRVLAGLHGGELRLSNRPEGGAAVEITMMVETMTD